MPTQKHDYATLSTPGTKKISVCARRVGSRERMAVIAVCTDETHADKIVDALNLHQGKMLELEVPAQRVLSEVRSVLATERDIANKLRADVRDAQNKLTDKQRELDGVRRELERAKLERDAAQKTARETA